LLSEDEIQHYSSQLFWGKWQARSANETYKFYLFFKSKRIKVDILHFGEATMSYGYDLFWAIDDRKPPKRKENGDIEWNWILLDSEGTRVGTANWISNWQDDTPSNIARFNAWSPTFFVFSEFDSYITLVKQ